jgi:hypothetical protein
MEKGNLTDKKREAPFLHVYFYFRCLPVASRMFLSLPVVSQVFP